MSIPIILKRSNVAGTIPNSASLELGELAVNTVDGKLYLKRANQDVLPVITIGVDNIGSLTLTGSIDHNGTGSFDVVVVGGVDIINDFSSSTETRLNTIEASSGGLWTSSLGNITRQSNVEITGNLYISESLFVVDSGSFNHLEVDAESLFVDSGSFIYLVATQSVFGTVSASTYAGFKENIPFQISGSVIDMKFPPVYAPVNMTFTGIQYSLKTGSCDVKFDVSGSVFASYATGSITTQTPWGSLTAISNTITAADELVVEITGSDLAAEHLSLNLLFTR